MLQRPVKIRLKENSGVRPSHCSWPYETPFHLRKAYTKEIKACLDAGILEKCGEEPSQWASKAFPVIKGNGKDVRIVSDFKTLNRAIERPHWPTESSDQLLRNIVSDSKYFVTLDLTSGYHQVQVDVESRNLLCISTPRGRYRYTTLAQGVCSAGDLLNFRRGR